MNGPLLLLHHRNLHLYRRGRRERERNAWIAAQQKLSGQIVVMVNHEIGPDTNRRMPSSEPWKRGELNASSFRGETASMPAIRFISAVK